MFKILYFDSSQFLPYSVVHMMSKKIVFMVVLLILLAFREKGRRKLSSLQQMSMDLWEIRQGIMRIRVGVMVLDSRVRKRNQFCEV